MSIFYSLMKTVPQRYMIDADVWIDYWSKSKPLFLEVLEKSVFSNDKLLQQILEYRNNVVHGVIAAEDGLNIFLSAHHGDCAQYFTKFQNSEYAISHSQCEVTNKIQKVLTCLSQFPQLIGQLVQFLELTKRGHGKSISRRAFVQQHLMSIPQFRALLEMADSEISALWQLLKDIIDRATTWLWKRCAKFCIEFRSVSFFLFSFKNFKSEKEKLWPLLLAFKNA